MEMRLQMNRDGCGGACEEEEDGSGDVVADG